MQALNARDMGWLHLPQNGSGQPACMTQRGCFEQQPAQYLQQVLNANLHARPRLVVAYAAVGRAIQDVLDEHAYVHRLTLRNCVLQTDDDNACSLGVWEAESGSSHSMRGLKTVIR